MKKLLQWLDKSILLWAVIVTSLFVVLYPKLPSIQIIHTWVYIRLEDFAISALVLLWFVQLVRRKVRLALPVGIPIIIYWIVGLASLIFSIVYIGPNLANYFPKIAALEYGRRIEYMILFFVGFSSIQSKEDLKTFIKFLFLGITAIIIYGLGQHFYPYFWKYLPQFFQKTNFCFPSFQTGNEEFAKGIPLCLPTGSRVTSTFGGHYDLAGYLLITLPIILGAWFFVKKRVLKVLVGALFVTGLITLILTASRIAFVAYIFAILPPLILLKKKKWIAPIILLSFVCLLLFSESTIRRFAQTFRITSVVVNMQGQVVGTTENGLSSSVKNQLAKGNSAVQANQVIQGVVPEGSSFITLPQQRIATTTAVIRQNLSAKDAQRLQLANGGLSLSTVKGDFSIQKALVYDISVTTRLQGEWPHAIAAFLNYPLLGMGYSTLTLAVDNDYLRLLGESGILGFAAFISIFVIFSIFLKQVVPQVEDKTTLIFIFGLIGGVIGLIINATLFDIFEASKVAEPLWLMLGIGFGAVSLYQKKSVGYLNALSDIASSSAFLIVYLLIIPFALFWNSLSQFFIGDDFVWLKWAATSTFADVPKYFTQAGGFFYRPLDKLLMLFFYSLFSFQPQGYHVVILFLHFLAGVAVYELAKQIFRRKLWAFFSGLLFILLPLHSENIFWISALSIDISAVFVLFSLIIFLKSNTKNIWKRTVWYIISIVLAGLGLLSYELALVIPLLLLAADVFIHKNFSVKRMFVYLPFIVLDGVYFAMRVASHAFGMSGDYSYSPIHFIPNVLGNIVGYFGLFIFGEGSLPWYTLLRTNTKQFAIPMGIIIVLLGVGLWFALRKTNWKKLITMQSIPLFALSFSLIALLPYLGLGNIAQRYGYLSSVGFVILAMWLFRVLFERVKIKGGFKYVLAIGFIALGGFLCIINLQKSQNDWGKASKITYSALGYFKIEYPTIPQQSTYIIINRPIRYANAWIFPVGLPEGLWFVYADTTPTVLDAPTLSQAKQLAKNLPNVYLFSFDKDYQLKKTE